MKRNKLFDECLSKVDPEVREYVRTQMDYQLMGLPTDEELEEWYEDMTSQSSARYIRNLAAQKLKEQKAHDIETFKKWAIDNSFIPFDYYNDTEGIEEDRVLSFSDLMDYLKAMEE